MSDYKLMTAETQEEYFSMREEAKASGEDFFIRLKVDGRIFKFEKFKFDENGRLLHWENSRGEENSFQYNDAGGVIYHGHTFPRVNHWGKEKKEEKNE